MQLWLSMSRPARFLAARLRSVWLPPGALLAPLLWSASAGADCQWPDVDLTWTYPNGMTDTVPPDAVFWAVSPGGESTVEVDGVPLSALGTDGVERMQFVSTAPLSEGEHELVARAQQGSNLQDQDGGAFLVRSIERRIPFRVAAGPVRDGDVAISSVEVYPLQFRGTPPRRVSPPPEEFDTVCSQSAIELSVSCNDTGGPSHVALVAYEFVGLPIAYLVQGGWIVPLGCESFWAAASPARDTAQFTVSAILPTGVAEERTFAGPVDFPPADPGPFQDSPRACSLDFERRPAPPMASVLATLAVIGAAIRRRTRQRVA
jgi:hypothetical protein